MIIIIMLVFISMCILMAAGYALGRLNNIKDSSLHIRLSDEIKQTLITAGYDQLSANLFSDHHICKIAEKAVSELAKKAKLFDLTKDFIDNV